MTEFHPGCPDHMRTAIFQTTADAYLIEHARENAAALRALSELAERDYDPDDVEVAAWHAELDHSRRAIQKAYAHRSPRVLRLALDHQLAVARSAVVIMAGER